MAINHYFQAGVGIGRSSEQNLIEDIIIECLKIYGFEVLYMPRQSFNPDMILNEDPLNNFKFAYPLEMYLQDIQGFQGEGSFLSKFGLEVRDTANFVVSRRRWDEIIAREGNAQLPGRPAEGDMIYFPQTQAFFEIRRVANKNPFFQVGKLYVYSLECELYQYSSEKFDTGVGEIDELSKNSSLDKNILGIGEPEHKDPQSRNSAFVDESAIIDFSESNPFGSPRR